MKYRRIDRFHDHHHYFYSYWCFVWCGMGTLITIALVGILLTSLFGHQCSIDGDCGSDYCKTGSCVSGRCVYDKKENCCVSHADCDAIECHTGLCDIKTHKCVLEQLPDLSHCDDNNKCTVQEKCQSGECVGHYACQDTQCTVAMCHPEQGCLHQKVANGHPCDDGSPCTVGDMCYNGVCASGIPKDCSHIDGDCTIGTCSDTTGECLGAPRREGEICDDGLQCTEYDHCEAAKCTGTQKTCEDSNPCVVNLCVEGVGCMEHSIVDTSNTSSCHGQCSDDNDCPGSYICHLGTCMNLIYNNPMFIRFIDYEIDKCDSNTSYRLVQHYVLDVMGRKVNQDTRYKVAFSSTDFLAHTTQPLGFPVFLYDDNVQTSLSGNFSRTSFTMGTECQELTEENCNVLFANRNYEFTVLMYDCVYPFVQEECVETGEQVGASIHLSIIDCPYTSTVEFAKDSFGTLKITDTNNIPKIVFAYEEIARIHLTADVTPWIQDIVVCVPEKGHHMLDCVLNANTTCPHRGCRGWTNSPLKYQAHLMGNGVLTAIARPNNIHTVSMCRDDSLYNENEWCEHDCEWADDGFSMDFNGFSDFEGDYIVFDVEFQNNLCSGRRLTESDTRSISYVQLK